MRTVFALIAIGFVTMTASAAEFPTLDAWAYPARVKKGESSRIHFRSSGAHRVELSGKALDSREGSACSGPLYADATFILSALDMNSGECVERSVTIVVSNDAKESQECPKPK